MSTFRLPTLRIPQQLAPIEEKVLKQYAELRELRKAVQALNAKKEKDQHGGGGDDSDKRTDDADQAKEQAKLLVKSGQIKLETERKQTFKRSRLPSSCAPEDMEEGEVVDPPSKSRRRLAAQQQDRHGRRRTPERGPTIYICGLPLDEKKVESLFRKFGTILTIQVQRFPRRAAFLTFETTDMAEKALVLNNWVDGNGDRWSVEFAMRQGGRDRPRTGGGAGTGPWAGPSTNTDVSKQSERQFESERNVVAYDDDMADFYS